MDVRFSKEIVFEEFRIEEQVVRRQQVALGRIIASDELTASLILDYFFTQNTKVLSAKLGSVF